MANTHYNVDNNGIISGHLTKVISEQNKNLFTNKDGSMKALFTVAVSRNYADKNGNYGTDFIDLEIFIGSKNAPLLKAVTEATTKDIVAIPAHMESYKDSKTGYTKQKFVADYFKVRKARAVQQLEQTQSEPAREMAMA